MPPDLATLSASIDTLVREVSRLTSKFDEQDRLLRSIELTTTTRMAELQKDVNECFNEIRDLKEQAKQGERNDTDLSLRLLGEQDVRDSKIAEQIKALSDYKLELAAKWEEQTKVNDIIHAINKILWATFLIMLSLFVAFIWEMVKSGGIANMVK